MLFYDENIIAIFMHYCVVSPTHLLFTDEVSIDSKWVKWGKDSEYTCLCVCVSISVHAFFKQSPAKCLELPRLFHVSVRCDSLPLYSSTVPTQRSAGSSKTNLCLLFPAAFRLSLSSNISPISRPSTSLLPPVSSIQLQWAIDRQQYPSNFALSTST